MNPYCAIKIQHVGYLAIIMLLLASAGLLANIYCFQYPQNNAWLLPVAKIIGSLLFVSSGILLRFGQHHPIACYAKEFTYFVLLCFVILVATIAVQYTPFEPIDNHLRTLDQWSHFQLSNLLAWTYHQPKFQSMLEFTYSSIISQLYFIPLLFISMRRFERLHEYYFLLIVATFIGYLFYYFFPTMAPASVIDSPYFFAEQKATGLKFQQLHHHIPPTTHEGGLIAFPSFHVIWAYFFLNLVRDIPFLFWTLFPFNCLLALSCVLLGWHYPIDLLGSAVVIVLAEGALHYYYLKNH